MESWGLANFTKAVPVGRPAAEETNCTLHIRRNHSQLQPNCPLRDYKTWSCEDTAAAVRHTRGHSRSTDKQQSTLSSNQEPVCTAQGGASAQGMLQPHNSPGSINGLLDARILIKPLYNLIGRG